MALGGTCGGKAGWEMDGCTFGAAL